jgi:GT2 family glycosyltransferase
MAPELSILIVNYRSVNLILDCLATVYARTRDLRFEVIVADNDSDAEARQRVLSVYPEVRWIPMGYNAGFARANNAAIRMARGKAVLLLNPDTLIEDNAITACYRLFDASAYVACGVQLLNEDRTPQITGSYFMKGGLNYLLPLPFLGSWIRAVALLFKVDRPHVPNATGLAEVDWVNGAFLMVKRSAFERAGLMDEDFFLYAEETEWCSRLRRLGKIAVFGELHIIHLQGTSANEAFGSEGKGYYNLYDRKGLQIMLSNFVRIRKQHGVFWFLVQVLFYVADIPVFFIGRLFSRRYSWAQLRGFCKNTGSILRLSPTILRNKPYLYKVL